MTQFQPQYGQAQRPLAFLGCPLLGSMIDAAPVPRRDTIGATKQITTVTVDAATNDEEYGITLVSTTPGSVGESVAVTFTADGSATVAEIHAGLLAAMYDSPSFMRFVDTITGASPDLAIQLKTGQSATFTLVSASGDLSQVPTQVGAAFQAYDFGRAVEVVAGPDSTVRTEGIRPLQLATGAVATVTVTTADNGSDSVTRFLHTPFGGQQVIKTLTFTSTAAQGTTVDAAVTAAEALFPTATVTDNTTNATIALPPGDTLEIITPTTNAGTLDTSTAVVAGGDLPRCAIVFNDQLEPLVDNYPTVTTPTSVSGRAIPTLDAGEVAVATTDTSLAFGALAYAETAAGANNGLLYDTPTATRIPCLVGPARVPARFGGLDPRDPSLATLQIGA